MKTNIKKGLTISSLIAFGLLAGCSDDSSSVQSPATGDSGTDSAEATANICNADGYTGFYAADGATIMCLDANGSLAFWINPDGTIGTPVEEAPASSAAMDVPQDPGTTPLPPEDVPVIPSSASATCDAGTATFLYKLADVSYYRDTDGATFFFDSDCNKQFLTEIVVSSSSETPAEKASSSSTTGDNPYKPTSSAGTETSSASVVPVVEPSNGNTPVITYAASGASVANNNNCVEVNGGEVLITCAGDYDFSGSYTGNDAQIRVYSPKSDSGVYLNLRGLTLTNNADAVIYVQMASKAFVVAKSGTENTLSDGSSRTKSFTYVNADGETKVDTTGACIYAKDDLTIKGEGSLTVKGNYNNGIHTSNDLRFRGETTVNVTAKNHGMKGKGLVDIEKGTITVKATSGDGIKSDEYAVNGNDTVIVEGKGIVSITGGTIDITAGDDGIQAFNNIIFDAGTVKVNASNDGIHSEQNVQMNGGTISVTAGDDGIHADSALHLAGSTVNVVKSGEGMEAFYIFAEGGITATYGTDDGWNAAGGSADPGTSSGSQWGGFGGGGMQSSSKGYIVITGGYHYISASGNDIDVLDANGTAKQSGGVVIVEIPASSGGMGGGSRPGQSGSSGSCSTNMAGGLIDTDNGFTITGGVFLGFGSQTEEYPNCTATSYTAGTAYGSASAAFSPKGSGSMILYGGSVTSVAQVNTSGMQTVDFPNGLKYYYK
ncbi:carbohydrate-binding domain-containing protein [Fibrobacter sp. UWT3]|uniref:carbohydrate-binding domain-containing protein n=1 Tax=Fibrobacter sp. UWT3 TaxID=1896225 RepID=UPI001597099C|nr:carbohydrate-binding domain-containing protein [Fibrobacter sp. UWT3]